MSAAQPDLIPFEELAPGFDPSPAPEYTSVSETPAPPSALKEQVAQRLAAHRARRGQTSAISGPAPIPKTLPARARSARIAATVAERYAHSQSYRAFLAAEAESAIRHAEAAHREAEANVREAEAAASVAAISAKAVADAQYELLAELDQWTLTPPTPSASPFQSASQSETASSPATRAFSRQDLTVKIFEEPTRPTPPPASSRTQAFDPMDEDERYALDEEIAFRQAPVFDEFRIVPGEIPANLIEFPRQLVAARRARPRLAEGPLREESAHSSTPAHPAQLRIFEVEAAHISTTAPPVESAAEAEPEWTSILLAPHPVASAAASSHPVFSTQFAADPAPLSLRLMAALVDACLAGTAFLAAVAAAAFTFDKISARFYASQPLPPLTTPIALQTAAIGVLITLAFLALLYQLLFFSFSDATPGMKYARIAFCTFTDVNPSRRRIRRRIIAATLAAFPLGLGFLWAWLDEESLGWHDRISRMYQRSY